MKTQSEKQFLKWVEARGMGLDARYPDSACLTFKRDPALDRFWTVPPKPEVRPHFLALMLDLMGKWQSCRVWRHIEALARGTKRSTRKGPSRVPASEGYRHAYGHR